MTVDGTTTDPATPPGDPRFMRKALALAKKAQGLAEPNPMVGAVIVRGNVILGQGWHRRYGQAHAEVNAIADAKKRGQDITGADMYVTLEPCAHFGKTPPCADAVIAAKLGRVFCAMVDPFPQVAGKGIAKLRDAGIVVHTGLLEQEARILNGPFLKHLATGLPWVILKWAQSIDGKIAAASGDSRWITGPAARQRVHQWRGIVDVVMVGIGTALADNPQLTARDIPGKPRRIARRVIVDPNFKTPSTHHVVTPGSDSQLIAPTTLAVSDVAMQEQADRVKALQGRGVEFFTLTTLQPASSEMDLRPLLSHLAQSHHASNILVEGGGRLHGSLIRQQLADELRVFVAPRIIGDDNARAGVASLDCPTMQQAMTVNPPVVSRVGDDVLLTYRMRQ